MIARRLAVTLVISMTAAGSVHAQLPERWSEWQFQAPVRAGAIQAERLIAATVSSEVTAAAAPGWSDLRVVDDSGAEVPFVLRARLGGTTAEWRPARLLDQGAAIERYAQIMADTGEQARVHNAVRLRTEGAEDFLTWVEVAAGDEAREWRVIRERAPIFRLQGEGMGEQLTLSYPDTPARYLRLRLLDGTRRYTIRGVDTSYEITTTAELIASPRTFGAATARPQQSAWVSSETTRATLAGFRVETPQPLFDRPLKVETSEDGSEWRHLASGQIYRTVERGQPRAMLELRVPETSAPHWRVTILNRNDPPLPDLVISALTIPRRVVFTQRPGRSYSLLYGNPGAAPPEYEMARLTDAATLDAAADVTVDAGRANAGYRNPAPWTERHPVAVWTALVVVVLLLAGLAYRTLKSA